MAVSAFSDSTPVLLSAQKLSKTKDIVARETMVDGLKMKNLVAPGLHKLAVKAPARRAAEDATFFESFEDGEIPSDWTVISKDESNKNAWEITGVLAGTGTDGGYCALANYSADYCDEWLITKPVTISDNEQLSFLAYMLPFYFYSTDNINWDTEEYIGDKIVNQTFKVLISADGGESWTLLVDYAEEFRDATIAEMEDIYNWETYSLSLGEYAGKTVQIAFEYEGTDGNFIALDAVTISRLPADASYAYPAYTKYFGLSKGLGYWVNGYPILPVFSPITWTNTSINPDNTYKWSYQDYDGNEFTSTDKDLTVTFTTNLFSEFSIRNNFYTAPTLTASTPGLADGTYQRFNRLQAGGKAQYLSGEELTQFGMSAFDVGTEGIKYTKYGLNDIPLFGYSEYTDQYWTEYSFPDAEDRVDGNYAYVDGVMNIYQATDAPLVIDGAWIQATSHDIAADHEFTIEIIPLTEEGSLDTPLASATIKGSDVIIAQENTYYDYVVLDFHFDKPVVISSAVCDQYVVRLTGIHECAEYFAPMQSIEDNPDGLYVGAVQKVVSWMNTPRTSLTMLFRLTGKRNAFAIMLDAAYPWLQGDDEVVLEDNKGTLALNSYYDGSQFSVQAPEWLKVDVAGIYGECNASFEVVGTPDATDTEATLSVLGFDKVVTVKGAQDGVAAVLGQGAKATDYFTLSGVKLSEAPTQAGIYMVRYSDGSVRKQVIK